jgi:DNA-binding transcriptional ArsR family regulator
MTNHAENLFDEYMEGGASPLRLKPEIMLVIASYLEDAITSSSRKEISHVSESLVALLNESIRRAPDGAVAAVRNSKSADESERASYLMGQVSFAQLIASQFANNRASDVFVKAMYHKAYFRYVAALFRNDLTNTELHNLIGERSETVSRKFKTLRALGIADFRRDGNSVVNFLTPLARHAFDESKVSTRKPKIETKEVLLNKLTAGLEEFMKSPLTFAPSSTANFAHSRELA